MNKPNVNWNWSALFTTLWLLWKQMHLQIILLKKIYVMLGHRLVWGGEKKCALCPEIHILDGRILWAVPRPQSIFPNTNQPASQKLSFQNFLLFNCGCIFLLKFTLICFISVTLLAEKPKLPEKKYYIDTNYIHLPKENMEIINPVKDGMSKYKEETVVLHNSPSYSCMLCC